MNQVPSGKGHDQLRELLGTEGPAAVFRLIASICEQEAHSSSSTEEADGWLDAAEVALDASLFETEDDADDTEGDDVESDDETDRPEDEECEPDVSEAREACVEEAPKRTAKGSEARENRTEVREKSPERTTMKRDDRLGHRPENAMFWQCKRLLKDGEKERLSYAEIDDGIATHEWPIKSCSPEAIASRWGDGSYKVYYITVDPETGKHQFCGGSRILHVQGRNARASEALAGSDGGLGLSALGPMPHIPNVMATPPMVSAGLGAVYAPPSHPAPAGTAPAGADTWTMITVLRDMDERKEARMAAQRQLEVERERLLSQEREARYRVEVEAQLERERLQSQERIKEMELRGRQSRHGGHADFEAMFTQLMTRITNLEETLTERDDDEEEEEEDTRRALARVAVAAPPPKPDPLTTVLEALAPVAQAVVTKLTAPSVPIPAIAAAPPSDPTEKLN